MLSPTLRSSRLAGSGQALTEDTLVWVENVFLMGDDELLLTVLDGLLELQGDNCSLMPLQQETITWISQSSSKTCILLQIK